MFARSSAATVRVDTKSAVSLSRVVQMVGVCLYSLRMSNCCMVEGDKTPTGPKLTVAMIPDY